MWKSLLWSLVQSWVLPELVKLLREEAKKSETPIDDTMVDWFDASKGEFAVQLSKAF